MDKLVSIITPCYNGEKYLDKYFQSILAQTYPAIEVIFVNDGSTDGTEEKALHYGKELKAKGYGFNYIFQENAGQSAAINQGLKVFKGEYLNWTDSEDFIPNNSIEKRVSFLEEHPETGLVIGRTIIVDDSNYQQIGLIEETELNRTQPKHLIEDYLKSQIGCTCCCSTMVRSSMFRDSMSEPLQIETPREIGQNYQLFIPIMFKYPTHYIPAVLGYYVVHSDSHSHSRKTFEQKLHIQDIATQTLNSVAERIKVEEDERKWFKAKIAEFDCKNRLEIHQHHHRKDQLSVIVKRLKQMGCYDTASRKMVLKIRYPIIKRLADYFWRKKNK